MRGRVLAALVSTAPLIASACTSGQGPSSATAPPNSTRPSVSASPSPTIALGTLAGKIVFFRAGGKYQDQTIYSAKADGSDEQRITPFGGQCCPRWSPDGAHILVSALAPNGRITTGIIDPDGSNERKIPLPGTLNLGPGAWSADGTLLAFEGWSDADPGLDGVYVARASDGGGLVRVATGSKLQDDTPFGFSPDGSQVFFARAVEGFPAIGDQLDRSLYAVNADGTGALRRITPPDLPVEIAGDDWGRLSTDGRWIVFASSGDLWTIHPDGSGLIKVFDDPEGRDAISPTWSPDGQFILFGLDPGGSLAGYFLELPSNGLYLIRADGTALTPLLVSDDLKGGPDWAATP